MRGRQQDFSSAYERLRQQAMAALNKLRKDIHTAESELSNLRQQEEQLGSIVGETGGAKSAGSNGAATQPRGGRLDWRAVLEKLPKRFQASDVRKVRGLANKRSGEIFAAAARPIHTGM